MVVRMRDILALNSKKKEIKKNKNWNFGGGGRLDLGWNGRGEAGKWAGIPGMKDLGVLLPVQSLSYGSRVWGAFWRSILVPQEGQAPLMHLECVFLVWTQIPVWKWLPELWACSGGSGATWPRRASPWAAALSTRTRARTASGALTPPWPPRRATRAATCPRPTRTGPRSGSVWTERD